MPGRGWLTVIAVACATATWMNLGTLHSFHHADSLIPVLVSTQRWTPFFWGQDRFGMLVPLLASPIRHPLANLVTQGWVMTASALLAPFVVGRFLTNRGQEWIAVGALANLLMLAVTSPVVRFDWLVTQPYALSIALGFLGLIVAGRSAGWRSSSAALVVIVLALWVNLSAAFLLLMAAALTPAERRRRLFLVAIAAAAGAAAGAYLPPVHTTTAITPVSGWMSGWTQLLQNGWLIIDHPMRLMAALAASAAAVIWLAATSRARQPITTAAIALAVAAANWLVLGTSLWVGMNRYASRYMFPSVMMTGVAVAIIGAAAMRHLWTRGSIVAWLAVAAATAAMYGSPSIRALQGRFDVFGRETGDVVKSGATVIAGDYWTVWPAVFHANLAHAGKGNQLVYGLTYRSEATDPLWLDGRRALIAGTPGDPSVSATADQHGVSLSPIAHLPSIDLFEGRAAGTQKRN